MTESGLLPLTRPTGSRRTSITARPHRLAYLVDPEDPDSALSAIEAACLEWGGRFQILIPCPPAGAPAYPWARILEEHDPDYLVDLVGASPAFLDDQRDRLNRAIHRWGQPRETMHLVGATVWSALHRWRRKRDDDANHEVLRLAPLTGHPLALPLAFRWGAHDPRPLPKNAVLTSPYRAARLDQFLTVRNVDPSTVPEHHLIRWITESPSRPSTPGDPGWIGPMPGWSLPGLTMIGLRVSGTAYYSGSEKNPERDQHDEAYFSRVVVVGDPASVPDLCLVWNLRTARSHQDPFPLWFAPSWLGDEAIVARIAWASNNAPRGELPPGPSRLHIMSASLDEQNLTSLLPVSLRDVVVHGTETLDRFFRPAAGVGITAHSVTAFDDGMGKVAVPDFTLLGDFMPLERVAWSLAIDGYGPPPCSTRTLPLRGTLHRLARDGLAGFVETSGTDPGDLVPIGTHTGIEVVNSFASGFGYSARISDKGQQAIAVVELVGDSGLWVLASSRLYLLLEDMAQIASRKAVQAALNRAFAGETAPEHVEAVARALDERSFSEGQFERQHRSYGEIRKTLGISDQTCTALVEWLVARRVLLQGFERRCPACGLRRWYLIDFLSDSLSCDGCRQPSRVPISPNTLAWRYRLNEVVAQAVTQGILPHLLALRRVDNWNVGVDARLWGALPGVLFEAHEGRDLPTIEVDLLAFMGGRVIIGECKAQGRTLDESGDEIERLVRLATLLGCSRLVFATATDFSEAAAAIERARALSGPIFVQSWERGDLLDPPTDSSDPGLQPEKYLDRIAIMARGHVR